jgi:hypothetical protein
MVGVHLCANIPDFLILGHLRTMTCHGDAISRRMPLAVRDEYYELPTGRVRGRGRRVGNRRASRRQHGRLWEAFVLMAPLFASLFCAFFGAFRTRAGLQSPPNQRAAKVTTLARPPAQGGPALLLVASVSLVGLALDLGHYQAGDGDRLPSQVIPAVLGLEEPPQTTRKT